MGSSTGNIQMTMTLDEARALQAFRRVGQAVDKVEKKVERLTSAQRRTGTTATKAGRAASGAFNPAVLTRFTGGLLGAGGVLVALRLVTAELERQREINREAASAQITLSSSRQDVLRNLGGRSVADKSAVLRAATDLASKSGIEEKYITAAFAQAISASGGNIESSIAAVSQAAKFVPDRPESLPQFAGGFLDMQKVTGSANMAVNQGLVQQVGALSRVVDPEKQAKNIPQAMIGLKSFGATPQEGGAFFAALSNAAADVEGRVTRTTAINVAKEVQRFLPDAPEGMAGPNFGTFGDKIAAIQGNKEAARAFAGSLTARASMLGPIRELFLDPSSNIATEFVKNKALIPGNAELAQFARDTIADRDIDPLNRVAATDRAISAATGLVQTQDLDRGLAGVNREGLSKFLKAIGRGALSSKVTKLGVDVLGDDPEEVLRGIVKETLIPLTMRRTVDRVSGGRLVPKPVDPKDEALVAALRGMIERLDKIAENSQRGADASERNGTPTLLARPDEDGPPPNRN